jgi:uncharacterized protein involved in outer membrane biogenesis
MVCMRRLARLLPYLAVFGLLAMAAGYFYTSGPLSQRLGQVITEEVQARTGRKASIGRVVFGPGRVVLHDVSLGDLDGGPFFSAPEVVLRGAESGVLPSLTALRQIRSIELRRPSARFVRLKKGGWNISDLLRKTRGKKHLSATITVKDATVTVVDMKRDGAVTALKHVEVAAEAQASGVVSFRGTAASAAGAFTKGEGEGEYDARTGLTKTKLHVTDLKAPYVMGRLPKTKAVVLRGGTAEVTGKLTIGKGGAIGNLTPDLRAVVRGADLTFPWLRRPVTGVSRRKRHSPRSVSRSSMRASSSPD